MKRLWLGTVLTVAMVASIAPAAQAGQRGVNAGKKAVAWDSTQYAYVIVDSFGGDVNILASSYYDPDYPDSNYDSSGWVDVKVKKVGAGALTVTANGIGDCTGADVTVTRKPHRVAIVHIEHLATGGDEVDCTYKRIIVGWSS